MKKIKSAYIGYESPDGSKFGIRVKTFKNISSDNSYSIDYVRNSAKAFNFIIGRFAYWSQRKNVAQSSVIIVDKDLSKYIQNSRSNAAYVLLKLRDLFNLKFTRQKSRGGARTITLNKQVIDFMKVYSEDALTEYIDKYEIKDTNMIYILEQIYKYRIWEVTDSQLSFDEKMDKAGFIYDNQNYYHYVATSNKRNSARIQVIEKHQDKLSEVQQSQLKRIKEESSKGRLVHYLFTLLIKLEQKITFLTRKKDDPNNEIDEQPNSPIDRNRTEGEIKTTETTSAVTQKIPEDKLSPRDYILFMYTWNDIAEDNSMPKLKALTEQRINSIDKLVKNYSKGELFKALKNIPHLYHDSSVYQYKMNFERFTRDETFVKLMELTSSDTRNTEESNTSFLNRFFSNIAHRDIPSFETITDAKQWLRAQKA